MVELSKWGQRCRGSLQEDTRRLLEELFSAKWQDVDEVLEDFSSVMKVPRVILDIVILSEAKPTDSNKWTRSWLNKTHVKTTLDKYTQEYWDAFGRILPSQVDETISLWMEWAAMPLAKVARMLSKPVKICKVYRGSKWLKDLWVISDFIIYRGLTLDVQLKNCVLRLKPERIEPWVWKWNKFDGVVKGVGVGVEEIEAGVQEDKSEPRPKYRMIEVGEEKPKSPKIQKLL